ncbi:MAG: putative aspartyl protease [Candidatus Alkanophagales archaeon MCA70_species_1]|nr:putative aspartyl protease [Candidatus Alkanophaga volatiphilum]
MGKVVEKVKLTSLFEPEKSLEVEAVIDTGATMVVLPRDIVEKLGLRKMREVKVRYANNKVETRPIYGVVNIELKGRSANLDVLVEERGSQPLIGRVLLELLDLIVEPKTRKLIPNPASPEMPMMEILMAKVYNSRYAVCRRSPKPSASLSALHICIPLGDMLYKIKEEGTIWHL